MSLVSIQVATRRELEMWVGLEIEENSWRIANVRGQELGVVDTPQPFRPWNKMLYKHRVELYKISVLRVTT